MQESGIGHPFKRKSIFIWLTILIKRKRKRIKHVMQLSASLDLNCWPFANICLKHPPALFVWRPKPPIEVPTQPMISIELCQEFTNEYYLFQYISGISNPTCPLLSWNGIHAPKCQTKTSQSTLKPPFHKWICHMHLNFFFPFFLLKGLQTLITLQQTWSNACKCEHVYLT